MVAREPNHLTTIAAFVVALASFGSILFLEDPTPLLVEPAPDLDWPSGLVGVMAGLWSAMRITQLPYPTGNRLGKVALWIMVPLFLGFGLPAVVDRARESLSFRKGVSTEAATVLLTEKREVVTRSGRVFYEATLASLVDHSEVAVRIDHTTFERIEPQRECVTIAIERASNGAVRLLKALRWNASCSATSR